MNRVVLGCLQAALLALSALLADPRITHGRSLHSSRDVFVRVDRSHGIGVSHMDTGVTHTSHSVDSWNNPAAVARGRALIESSSTFQNQFIYGWGTVNPEPAPGRFDWGSLDDRIKAMRSMHATMVITLCCAPDWMTSLGKNTSTYSLLPPTPAHYGDFAQLARRIALRYPDVRYYQVWSELRGFYDPSIFNWDPVPYTRLYNAVYDALKSVNRQIQVGGPYIMVEGSGTHLGHWSQLDPPLPRNMYVIEYWLKHMHGADFISMKRNAKGDHDPLRYPPARMMQLASQYEEIARKIRKLTNLPIWWAENFFEGGGWSYQSAGLSTILYHELLAGSRVSLLWGPEGTRGNKYGGNYQNLFSDTRYAGGGKPYPYYYAFRAFHVDFPPGTTLYRTTSSAPDVKVLASSDRVMLINQRAAPITVHVNGFVAHMNRYGVRILDR